MNRAATVAILFLSFFGIADSVYVAREALSCFGGGVSCNSVTSGAYANLFGVPLAEYGILFYMLVFVLAALELYLVDRLLRRTLQTLASVGFVVAFLFSAMQVLVFGAFCPYCLASAFIALLLFLAATRIESLPPRTFSSVKKEIPPPFSMPPTS